MLPHVEHEQRHGAVADVALVVVYLLGHEPLGERLPRERSPARTLDVECGLVELALEVGHRAERFFNGIGQLPVGLASTVRAHVAPEERVQYVSGEMKGEVLL